MTPRLRGIGFIVGVLLAGGALAAPLEYDLGQGLAYVRVHELPGDLPAQPAGQSPPCVVDVRYVRAEPDAAQVFLAWVRFRATARSPVFVLANGETSLTLVKALAGHERPGGIVLIGPAHALFRSDVTVKVSDETERLAYNALERGTPLTALLADNPDKVRNDEASLSKDRPLEAVPEAAPGAPTGKRPPPPVDATLQRAVHLHRALVALKKI